MLHDVQLVLANIFAKMLLLEHGSNRDNCCGDITHGQLIGKQILYRPYKRIGSFNERRFS